jgi:uncharacterized protein YajQ (UPF0234 family)
LQNEGFLSSRTSEAVEKVASATTAAAKVAKLLKDKKKEVKAGIRPEEVFCYQCSQPMTIRFLA